MSSLAFSRAPTPVGQLLRDWAGLAAYACAAVSVVAIFAVSGVVLDAIGYHYDSEGGSALQKVHPATVLMVLGLAFRVLARPTLPGLRRLLLGEASLVVALASALLAGAYIAAVLEVPITPPIDSYLMPVLACLLLKDMSRFGMRLIAVAILCFFVFNDLVAFYEYASGTHVFFIIPEGVTGHPEAIGSDVFDWKGHLAWDQRSTGMMGHPLDNAMMSGLFVMVLQMRAAGWVPAVVRAGVIALNLAAMVTFGGRVALALVVAMSGLLWAVRFLRLVRAARRLPLQGLAGVCVLIPLVVAGVGFAYERGFFDRFLERFVDDEGSTQARVVMWRLFEPLSIWDLVAGPDQEVVQMWRRLEGLELGIESFWAGMPLVYGVFVMAVILTGWVGLFAYLSKATARQAWLPILYFMIVASTSAGLASKTVSIGNLVACTLLFLAYRPRAPHPASRAGARARLRSHADDEIARASTHPSPACTR